MIAASAPDRQQQPAVPTPPPSADLPQRRWQRELAEAITRPDELLRLLDLDPRLAVSAVAAAGVFRLRVPRSFVRRMRRGDLHDPLLRQVLPLADELESPPHYVADPLAEAAAVAAPALLQKYRGRALIIATGACGVHCRYCFRREFPYSAQTTDNPRLGAAIAAIAADSSISEVLLSGGDPLSLSDERLQQLTLQLVAIPHVERIRVHTRQPVVLPSRVDAGLLHWIAGVTKPLVFVLHSNHAQEIDAEVRAALQQLRHAGVTLLNQSVLLAGVNDSVPALAALSQTLFSAGVLPYYLHLLDPVRGAAHFDVEQAHAARLVGELATLLPGYLVPRLVREVPGMPAKVPVAPRL
ncbi:MAG TPA: EF-P beta-lysylation protein EpmB [Steroidobacteraceae bacterium]|mgnify:CR=1 FL=1|nr:EF-P beta-lysylation protein EpmB [Steroidobacteraceae bacterium]HRX89495.1 EF-P beta-lysylation protein EpmB [Steroidobacteraceae bacterium]